MTSAGDIEDGTRDFANQFAKVWSCALGAHQLAMPLQHPGEHLGSRRHGTETGDDVVLYWT